MQPAPPQTLLRGGLRDIADSTRATRVDAFRGLRQVDAKLRVARREWLSARFQVSVMGLREKWSKMPISIRTTVAYGWKQSLQEGIESASGRSLEREIYRRSARRVGLSPAKCSLNRQ